MMNERPEHPGDASDPRPLGDPAVIRQQEEADDMALGSTASGHADTERHVAATLCARLEERVALYERVMAECHAEKVQADAENAAEGKTTHFADAPCGTCDETRDELLPLLREALAALAAAEQGRQEAEQALAHWKVCSLCGGQMDAPGHCAAGNAEGVAGLRQMHEETLTRAEAAEARVRELEQDVSTHAQEMRQQGEAAALHNQLEDVRRTWLRAFAANAKRHSAGRADTRR